MNQAKMLQIVGIALSVVRSTGQLLRELDAQIDEGELSEAEREQLRQHRRALAEETRRLTPVPSSLPDPGAVAGE